MARLQLVFILSIVLDGRGRPSPQCRETDLFERWFRFSGLSCGVPLFFGLQSEQHHVEHDADIDYDDEQAKPIWAL